MIDTTFISPSLTGMSYAPSVAPAPAQPDARTDSVQLDGGEPPLQVYGPRLLAEAVAVPPGARPLKADELHKEQGTVQDIERQAPQPGRSYRQEGGPRGPYGPTGVDRYTSSPDGQVHLRSHGTISDNPDGTRQDVYQHTDGVMKTPAGTVHVSVSHPMGAPNANSSAEINVLSPDGKSGYVIQVPYQDVDRTIQQLPAAQGKG